MTTSQAPSVFNYLDYRQYLRDYYAYWKASRHGFSHRVFIKRATLRAPNHLKLVIDGKRNISPRLAPNFARGCKLEDEAADYFIALVRFSHTQSNEEKNEILREIHRYKNFKKAHLLDEAQWKFYTNWYIPVVFELASHPDFTGSAQWVHTRVRPTISKREAKEAISTLVTLGLIKKKGNRMLPTHQSITTGPEVRSLLIANYHRAMIHRAIESIDVVPSNERDISSLTFSIRKEIRDEIKKRIQSFRKELLSLAENSCDPADQEREVIQLNFQLFPVSQEPRLISNKQKTP